MESHGPAPDTRVRLRLAPCFGLAGAVVILLAHRSVNGENCLDQYFGVAHLALLAAAGLGLTGFLLGYEYREDRIHLSQAVSFVVFLGAWLELLDWFTRGCGD